NRFFLGVNELERDLARCTGPAASFHLRRKRFARNVVPLALRHAGIAILPISDDRAGQDQETQRPRDPETEEAGNEIHRHRRKESSKVDAIPHLPWQVKVPRILLQLGGDEPCPCNKQGKNERNFPPAEKEAG